MADPAVYILSGAMPLEGVIHKRALVLFGSFCRLDEESVEKRLARRQLAVKSFESNSWFVATRKLFRKYDLPDCWDLVENPLSKTQWYSLVLSMLTTTGRKKSSPELCCARHWSTSQRMSTTGRAYDTEARDWHLHIASE